MTPEQWQHVKDLLDAALERPAADRSAYLDQACSAAPELRREVEALIRSHEQAGSGFLSSAATAVRRAMEAQWPGPLGTRIGPYRIIEKLGFGGMGAVYRAVRDDDQYQKQVAIKLIRPGIDSEFIVSRFRSERQILASLEHPNIARLLDGGATEDGLPYFVMELIEGSPIDEHCDNKKLTITERLRLFQTVGSAVQYAHQHLVVHRDIKPGNILITRDGTAKLLDFGIAKLLSSQESGPQTTLVGMRMLTPEYASPEQLRGEPISTASDVYSLGLVLYRLLTGHSAYRLSNGSLPEIMQAVMEDAVEKPSSVIYRAEQTSGDAADKTAVTPELVSSRRESSPEKLARRLSGDLDNIVLKALRKEPGERYASVEQLSEDVRRHLVGLPIIARQGTAAYRVRKFIHRHRVGMAATAAVFVALMAGIALTAYEARIARAQQARAERRFNDVRKLSNSLIFEIHDSIQGLPGATPARKALLERAREYLDGLAAESSGDISLQRELAGAYERLGLLQGSSLDANTGETEAGIRTLQKAVSMEDAVAKANPGNLDDQLSAAHGHSSLSSLLGSSGRPGAREELEKAIAITNRLLSTDASNSKVLIQQAIEYDHLAFFQDDTGDVQGSVESLKKALATGEAILRSAPQDRKQMNRVAIARVRLGNELVMLGRRKEALDLNRAGLDLYEALTPDETNAKARREMAVTLVFRGTILMQDGDIQGALEVFRRSLGMLESLQRTDPKNVLYSLDFAGASANTGRALADKNQFLPGMALLDHAIAIYRESFARDQSYTDIPYLLALTEVWKGEALAKSRDLQSALASHTRAAAGLESLLSRADNDARRCDLAAIYDRMGALVARTGNMQEAAREYQKALRIAEPLAAKSSPSVLAFYAVADAYTGMGELSRMAAENPSSPSRERRQHWSEAREWYRKSANAWQKISNPGRETPSGIPAGDPKKTIRQLERAELELSRIS